jgi:hypothetical protein
VDKLGVTGQEAVIREAILSPRHLRSKRDGGVMNALSALAALVAERDALRETLRHLLNVAVDLAADVEGDDEEWPQIVAARAALGVPRD